MLFTKNFVLTLLTVFLVSCGSSTQEDAHEADVAPPSDSVGTVVDTEPESNIRPSTLAASDELAEIERHLADSNTADDALYLMLKAAGGYTAYVDLLETAPKDEIVAFHAMYGINFVDGGSQSQTEKTTTPDAPPAARECVEYLPVANSVFKFDSHVVAIDWIGRPAWAQVAFRFFSPVPTSTVANTTCQGKVTDWAKASQVHAGSDPTTWHGGHLVPRILLGFSGRANLFPQVSQLNNGPWRVAENAAQKCVKLGYRVFYRINLNYLENPFNYSGNSIVPSDMDVILNAESGPVTMVRTFNRTATEIPNLSPFYVSSGAATLAKWEELREFKDTCKFRYMPLEIIDNILIEIMRP